MSSFGEPLHGAEPDKPTAPGAAEFIPGKFGETKGGAVTGRSLGRYDNRPMPEIKGDIRELPGLAVGTGAQVVDMGLSTAKGILGIFPYASTYYYAKYKGEPDKLAAQAAKESKEWFFPPELSTPWAKVAESMGKDAAEAYYKNPVGWAMGKIGEVAKEGTAAVVKDSSVPEEHLETLLDFTMGWLMKKPIQAGLKEGANIRATAKAIQDQFADKGTKPVEPTDLCRS